MLGRFLLSPFYISVRLWDTDNEINKQKRR